MDKISKWMIILVKADLVKAKIYWYT